MSWAVISKQKSDFSGEPKCKIMVRCDIGTAYYDNWTVNCKKKNKVPPNVKKYSQKWYWYCLI